MDKIRGDLVMQAFSLQKNRITFILQTERSCRRYLILSNAYYRFIKLFYVIMTMRIQPFGLL